MKLKELLAPWIQISADIGPISALKNDSREVLPGDVFLAYPGAVTDGRLFISGALEKGASFILYEPENWPADCPLPDENSAADFPGLASWLSALASRFYENPSERLAITGVTGTNGKTSIAWQLAQAHELLGQQAVYVGTLGFGRPHSLKSQPNTTPDGLFLQQFFATCLKEPILNVNMEVSSHALAQKRVDDIHFRYAVFTNLSLDHLDYHQTMEAYAQAKALLFAKPSLEWAIVNQDDPYSALMRSAVHKNCKVLSYGFQEGADVRALTQEVSLQGTGFEITSPWGRHRVSISAPGFFNIYNAMAVFSCLMLAGYTAEAVLPIMSRLKSAPGRMEVVLQKPCVIVDFAHTPDALENVLRTLSNLKEGRIITVFGCGGDRDKTKRPLMGEIAARFSDVVIITSDNPRSEEPSQILQEIRQGIPASHPQVIMEVDRKEAISKALGLAYENDIILVAGKGHESYQQIGGVRYEFSDQTVIRSLDHTAHSLSEGKGVKI